MRAKEKPVSEGLLVGKVLECLELGIGVAGKRPIDMFGTRPTHG